MLKHFEPFYKIELITPASQKYSFGHKKWGHEETIALGGEVMCQNNHLFSAAVARQNITEQQEWHFRITLTTVIICPYPYLKILSCESQSLLSLVYLEDRKNLPVFYVACSPRFSLFNTFLTAIFVFFFLLIHSQIAFKCF